MATKAPDMNAVLEWAVQYYCSVDDHDMLSDLLPLHACMAEQDSGLGDAGRAVEPDHGRGLLESDREPLHVAFYRLRKAADDIGPSYLRLDESEEILDNQEPWASPLNLEQMAIRTRKEGPGAESHDGNGAVDNSADPFSSPFSSPSRPARQRVPRHVSKSDARDLDVPFMVSLLIRIESARRHFAVEFLAKRNAQGSVAEQSERWQHRFAKRNIAAETKFENILVALKELVVLRAIVDASIARAGELHQVLGRMGAEEQRPAPGGGFDAAQCLAVLNLMFPLAPLRADACRPLDTEQWQRRYAFPLTHVPNPRMQLHQLLCETEGWINGDDRVATTVGPAAEHSVGALLGQGAGAGDSDAHRDKRARTDGVRMPSECPTWMAAARGVAWGQLRQSLQAYLCDTQRKIADQYCELHPWAVRSSISGSGPVAEGRAGGAAEAVPESLCSLGGEGHRMARVIQSENELVLREAMRQASPSATVLERIVRHSRLMKLRFSPHAAYDALTLPGTGT
ncbi:hypothetical protein H4R18_000989 [Coemansia javaensis]|uniref:Uncharacterized protein n=1 Tax=Coemansia javaensis TaxID=2761396 RepID=A0A9W8LM97_9FUNG|nr:hypothetical protein H4R18_000989 [Coemansia javaensis]